MVKRASKPRAKYALSWHHSDVAGLSRIVFRISTASKVLTRCLAQRILGRTRQPPKPIEISTGLSSFVNNLSMFSEGFFIVILFLFFLVLRRSSATHQAQTSLYIESQRLLPSRTLLALNRTECISGIKKQPQDGTRIQTRVKALGIMRASL